MKKFWTTINKRKYVRQQKRDIQKSNGKSYIHRFNSKNPTFKNAVQYAKVTSARTRAEVNIYEFQMFSEKRVFGGLHLRVEV